MTSSFQAVREWILLNGCIAFLCVSLPSTFYGQWANCSGTSNPTCTSSYVGVGTTSPAAPLDVAASDAGGTGGELFIHNGGSSTVGNTAVLAFGTDAGATPTNNPRIEAINVNAGNGASELAFFTHSGGGVIGERVRIDKTGNVGIGDTTPSFPLVVNSVTGPQIVAMAPAGSDALVGLAPDNEGLTWGLYGSGAGYFYLYNFTTGVFPVVVTPSAAANTLVINGSNVGIGVVSPSSKLAVNGTISASEVVVTSSPSDYVFDPGYRLRPLSEVANFIKTNGHLPEIPSGRDVLANGVAVGEMQSKLLAKIEELTLHMIAADEKNSQLERQNRELQLRVGLLETNEAHTPRKK